MKIEPLSIDGAFKITPQTSAIAEDPFRVCFVQRYLPKTDLIQAGFK